MHDLLRFDARDRFPLGAAFRYQCSPCGCVVQLWWSLDEDDFPRGERWMSYAKQDDWVSRRGEVWKAQEEEERGNSKRPIRTGFLCGSAVR